MKEQSIKAVAVSDTHGNNASLGKIALAYKQADYLFHLGDNVRDALWLEREMPDTKVLFARGNCDPGSGAQDFEEVTIKNHKIILTHGHLLKAKFSYDRLLYYAQEHEAAAMLFGHTHVAYMENIGGIWLINPGAAGERSRGDMTVCAMMIGAYGIVPKIVDIDTPAPFG